MWGVLMLVQLFFPLHRFVEQPITVLDAKRERKKAKATSTGKKIRQEKMVAAARAQKDPYPLFKGPEVGAVPFPRDPPWTPSIC